MLWSKAEYPALQLPTQRRARVWDVVAEGPGMQGGLEVPGKRGAVLGDAVENSLDRARHVDPGTLSVGADLSVAPANSDRRSELVREKLALLLRAGGALGVVPLFGLAQLLLELVEARSVLRLRLRIEHRPGVARRTQSGTRLRACAYRRALGRGV